MAPPIRVLLEQGRRRTFANALAWPGWSRSGRNEQAALEALVGYADRYAPVASADAAWPRDVGLADLVVVERVPGTATTDFGAPDAVAAEEYGPVPVPEAERMALLVRRAWAVFDEVVAVTPPVLRKGPRGGGRDREAILAHVVGAEAAYARCLGLHVVEPEPGDRAAVEALREGIVEVLSTGMPRESPRRRLWPVAYAARRIAWHVLDHAWEMEDRRE